MNKVLRLPVLLCLFFASSVFSFSVSSENAAKIGERIWKNECAGTVDGLTHWKKGENFASFGIGHFIWYSQNKRERFTETFPALIAFLQGRGALLPAWLKEEKECPWNSREEFYEQIQSPKMKSLRQFLFDTKNLQAIFMASRLEQSFAGILEKCSKSEKPKIQSLFNRLVKDADGLYALIDYLNFKGEGTSSAEMYKGQGWGLLQVLQRMPDRSERPLTDFVQAARAVLQERVKNAPSERNEAQWLKGWLNRVDTYH